MNAPPRLKPAVIVQLSLSASVLLAVACFISAGEAAAAQLTWFGNGADEGGSGNWDTFTLNWSASGSGLTTWSNTANHGATFDNGPGDVIVDSGVAATNLTFNDTGFFLLATGTGAVTLASPATINVAGFAQAWILGPPLKGSAGMTVSGGGELILNSTNTYTGVTTVSQSYLQLAGAKALSSGNLVIDGGVIELAAGSFTLGLGTAVGTVQFTPNGGGFAAAGANYNVNLGGSLGTLAWGSSNFLPSSGAVSAPLILGSPWADSTINFQNPINLGAADRTVEVNQGSGSAAVDAELSGVLSGSGRLIVTGGGALALTASNSFSGGTVVGNGLLAVQNAAALGSGVVTLDGGTLQLAASPNGKPAVALAVDSWIDVTGVTAGTLGNLSIDGNTLFVTGGGTASNTPYSLTLGSGTLTGNPTFDVANNGTGVGTLILGALNDGGTERELTKAGSGVLILSGSDTYSGGTVVEAGILDALGFNSLPSGSSLTVGAHGMTVCAHGIMTVDPSATGLTAAVPTTAAVPEPGTLALLVAWGLLVFMNRKRRLELFPTRFQVRTGRSPRRASLNTLRFSEGTFHDSLKFLRC